MTGEKNIMALIKGMKPEMKQDVFVFCSLSDRESLPDNVSPIFTFAEYEGLTIILRKEEAEQLRIPYEFPSRIITLTIHSALEAVGFLAAITTALAEASISVNAVSAFYHDHLFVPEERAEDAMNILLEMARN